MWNWSETCKGVEVVVQGLGLEPSGKMPGAYSDVEVLATSIGVDQSAQRQKVIPALGVCCLL